ncbi:MBL fold metallo-hydrolase [bacterium]|nr:MBL fold metallo-hydrolase [bacterium]
MNILSYYNPPLYENCYLIYDNISKEAFVIDPGAKPTPIIDFLKEYNFSLKGILNTHGHFDHVLYNDYFKERYSIPIYASELEIDNFKNAQRYGSFFGMKLEPIQTPTNWITSKDRFSLGEYQIDVIETPGHSEGSLCFYIASENILFSGDTLFHEGIGRTDLPGGDFNSLKNSIHKLFELPDNTRVYSGHGSTTTILHEKKNNYINRYL